MFCNNCGSAIPDGAPFCSNCGSAVNGAPQAQMQQFQNQKNAIRQSEIAALENAKAYFEQKRDIFNKYDQLAELVVEFAGGAKKSLIVWGAIIFVIGFIILVTGGGGASVLFLLPGSAMIAGGILMQINNKKKYNQYLNEFADVMNELSDYYNAYPNCPVGAEYANPDIIECILGAIKSGRADTVKESINLLISDAERAELNARMEAIETYAAQTSASAATAAFFSAANFFKD